MRLFALSLFAAGLFASGALKLGKPLALKEATPIEKITSHPADYVGKMVQVQGKIADVCQNMGCWMMLVDGSGNAIRIKVNDGDITFPKDSAGKTATAEGKLIKIELTKEQAIAQARHEAEENKRKFDPSSVKSGVTIYQVQGIGAVIE